MHIEVRTTFRVLLETNVHFNAAGNGIFCHIENGPGCVDNAQMFVLVVYSL